jgi:hypothetical protein
VSESAKALLIAALVGMVILIGPLALLAAGVIEAQTMLLIQGLILGGIYGATTMIKAKREEDERD